MSNPCIRHERNAPKAFLMRYTPPQMRYSLPSGLTRIGNLLNRKLRVAPTTIRIKILNFLATCRIVAFRRALRAARALATGPRAPPDEASSESVTAVDAFRALARVAADACAAVTHPLLDFAGGLA